MERNRDSRLDRSASIGNGRAVERVVGTAVRGDHPPAGCIVEAGHAASQRNDPGSQAQWTILASGSSMMSLAPASHRSGIKMLMSALGTTVSTA